VKLTSYAISTAENPEGAPSTINPSIGTASSGVSVTRCLVMSRVTAQMVPGYATETTIVA